MAEANVGSVSLPGSPGPPKLNTSDPRRRARSVAGNPLCLVSVHAHPDDEASKGAGTVARYAAEGIRAALVCCTGGEEGEILNPAADTPEVRADLQAVREAELRASADAIGYARV